MKNDINRVCELILHNLEQSQCNCDLFEHTIIIADLYWAFLLKKSVMFNKTL